MLKITRCVCSVVLLRCIALHITWVFMSANEVRGLQFLSVIYLNHVCEHYVCVCVYLCLCVWVCFMHMLMQFYVEGVMWSPAC